MDPERWQLMQRLFREALTLPDRAARQAFLADACGDDIDLGTQVAAMLDEDASGDSLLDKGVGFVAGAMLDTTLPPPGARIGRYTVKRLLGEGGMGVVYLAERADLGNVVAIKVLRDAWLSPARRERFHSEQRLLAQLNHPGIARLYDADTLPDGTPWFAMEYVEGVALTDYCRLHDCSVERRLQLFRQACEAVRFSHAHAVIHRDIKPSNILVTDDGSVRLLDFGIAKQLDALDGTSGKTRTVLRLMTPAYAAPEQLLGDKVGVQADVYSLGVVLFELLTGRLPFDLTDLSAVEATSLLVDQVPPTVSECHAGGTGRAPPGAASWADLDVLCLTAIHRDRSRRYSSVEALIRDVDHYLKSEPLEARPDALSYRAGKFLRRHWEVASVTAAAAAVALGLSAFFTLRLATALDAAQAEAARTERVQRFMANLFQGGDEIAGPSENIRIVDMLERGSRDAEALAADPPLQAELLHNLAGIYHRLGRHEEADALYTKSLALRSEAFGRDSPQAAESLVAIGLLRIDQARIDDGEALIREGLTLAERLLPPGHAQVVAARLALGRTLRERGAYDEAIEILSLNVARQSEPGVAPADRAAALAELADAHYAAGHYEESEFLYEDILEQHRALVGDTHPLVASDLASLAAIEQDLGYYDKAEALSREALAINESYYGAESSHTADSLTSLGRALTYQARYDDAAVVLRRALAVQEAAHGPSHPLVAEATNELGNIMAMQDKFDQAAVNFQRAADIYEAVHGKRHYLVAIALSNVAYMHMQRQDYAAAESLFREVIPLFSETLSPDNVNTGIARIKLGRTLLRAGRYAEAELESLAGYEIVAKQASPSISYLRAARADLIAGYEAMEQPDKAARFRAESEALDQAQ